MPAVLLRLLPGRKSDKEIQKVEPYMSFSGAAAEGAVAAAAAVQTMKKKVAVAAVCHGDC